MLKTNSVPAVIEKHLFHKG